MKTNKSKLIIAISVIAVIVVAIVIGVVLYLTTDMFKSNQQLFLKYALQNGEMLEEFMKYSKNSELEALKQNQYTTNADFTFELVSSDTQIANQTIPARNFSMNYTAKADSINNKASSETTLKFLTKDLFTLKYIQDGDLYAIKSDEVVNKYLAFNNSNLKGLAKKFEVADTSKIPNQIEKIDFTELFKLSKEQKEKIVEKYSKVINSKVANEKYTKNKNVAININNKDVTVNAYGVELTAKEYKQLYIALLEELQKDSETLNLLLQKVTLINKDISLDALKTMIQEKITKLNESSEVGSIKILVYEKEEQLVRTVIVNQNNEGVSITYTKSDNAIKAVFDFNYTYIEEAPIVEENTNTQDNDYTIIQDENTNQNAEEQNNVTTETQQAIQILKNLIPKIEGNIVIKNIEIAKQAIGGQYQSVYIVTFEKGEETIKVALQDKTTNDIANSKVDSNIVVNININDNTYFKINENKQVKQESGLVIEELVKQNSATVNDFTPKYIAELTQAIVNRMKQLYIEKKEIVNTVQQEEQQTQPQTQLQEQTQNTNITEENSNTNAITNKNTINTNNTVGQNNV